MTASRRLVSKTPKRWSLPDATTALPTYAGTLSKVALKARICRTLNWAEFPSTTGEFQSYRSFQTHELNVLLRLSGQTDRIRQNEYLIWNTLHPWRPESRYNVVGTTRQADATEMINAAERLLAVI